MASTEFHTMYTKRRAATDGPLLLLYCKGSKETQEMYTLSHMTGVIAIVEPDHQLTMKVAPIYKKVGVYLRYILLNDGSTKFTPAVAAPGMLENFPT